MARTIEEIQGAIIADKEATPELAVYDSTSKRALWRLWCFVVASAILLVEQLLDIFTANNEAIAAAATPATPAWIAKKVLEFQYSATNPQVIQLIDLVPTYPVIATELRIITRCSVVTTLSNQVKIKVAKGTTPTALSADELSALQDYVNTIGVAGVTYLVESSEADKLFVGGDIYYAGQYSAVIAANVITAIESYLATIPFNGTLKISDLEKTIRNVTGANDVVLRNIAARRDTDVFADATFLVQDNTLVSRLWQTVSGYIIGETTSGDTLTDSLNFIAE